jgi:hypothetical protein
VWLSDDDDSSTSSTVPVTIVATPCLQSSNSNKNDNAAGRMAVCLSSNDDDDDDDDKSGLFSKPQKKNNKTVCIDEKRNVFYDNTHMHSREECKRLWYSVPESLRFKEATMGLARQVARFEECDTSNEHSYRRVLERTYEACCVGVGVCQSSHNENESTSNNNNNNNDSTAVVEGSSSATIILTAAGEQALEQWIDRATTRLGLEKRAIRLIALDRSARRKCMTRTVLAIQKNAPPCNNDATINATTTTTTTTTASSSPELKAELLRSASLAISRPSRLFAEVMARALSAVVRRESNVVVGGGSV